MTNLFSSRGKARSHGSRIWSGDITALEESYRRYREDPVNQLIPYASDLYSFRRHAGCREALIELGSALRAHVPLLAMAETSRDRANQADVLAAILHFLSRKVHPNHSREYRQAANWACRIGLQAATLVTDPMHAHSYCFLKLRQQLIQLEDGGTAVHARVRAELHDLQRSVVRVRDRNQRARTFVLLGMAYRELDGSAGDRIRGLFWGVRAIFVWGIPLNVRGKAVAALFGFKP